MSLRLTWAIECVPVHQGYGVGDSVSALLQTNRANNDNNNDDKTRDEHRSDFTGVY